MYPLIWVHCFSKQKQHSVSKEREGDGHWWAMTNGCHICKCVIAIDAFMNSSVSLLSLYYTTIYSICITMATLGIWSVLNLFLYGNVIVVSTVVSVHKCSFLVVYGMKMISI